MRITVYKNSKETLNLTGGIFFSSESEEEEEEVILTEEEMNKLGAKLVKAEIMGNTVRSMKRHHGTHVLI